MHGGSKTIVKGFKEVSINEVINDAKLFMKELKTRFVIKFFSRRLCKVFLRRLYKIFRYLLLFVDIKLLLAVSEAIFLVDMIMSVL